jgi:hypothetical protein
MLTRKEVEFIWKDEQQKAFETLKTLLSSEPSLRFPDYSKSFHIFTDASTSGQGGALMQYNENSKSYSAVSYCSRTLSKSERKWPPVQIELGAIIFALREFRPYVFASKVELHTDHKPLSYLLKKSEAHPNLARWLIELQNYNVNIVHIAGKQNSLADALSRAHEDEEPDEKAEELKDIAEYPTCLSLRRLIVEPHSDTVHIRVIDEIESIDIRTAQAEDTETADLIRFLSSGETPSEATPQEIENLAALATKLIV